MTQASVYKGDYLPVDKGRKFPLWGFLRDRLAILVVVATAAISTPAVANQEGLAHFALISDSVLPIGLAPIATYTNPIELLLRKCGPVVPIFGGINKDETYARPWSALSIADCKALPASLARLSGSYMPEYMAIPSLIVDVGKPDSSWLSVPEKNWLAYGYITAVCVWLCAGIIVIVKGARQWWGC